MVTSDANATEKGQSTSGSNEYVGTTDAADELGVSPATLRRWLKQGILKGVRKVGRQWRISRQHLESLVAVLDEEPFLEQADECASAQWETRLGAVLQDLGVDEGRLADAVAEVDAAAALALDESDPVSRRLLAKLLAASVLSRTTDLHVEPQAKSVLIRQRIDGALSSLTDMPTELLAPLTQEIGRWAHLNLSERHRPQDGRFETPCLGRSIDVRVSTFPSTHGEVVTLRVLDRQEALGPMAQLGLDPDELERFRRIIRRPQGLVVVTAPTGCGKTTTVYHALLDLVDPARKIMAAEDPVEFDLEGVSQAAVNPARGITFSQLTRAMLRQAANVLFVGEIRDAETAHLLCAAAQTGHTVFTSLHTGDALSGLTRLADLDVPAFLLGSALQCVLAQRLVRVLCPHCKTEHQPTEEQLDALGLADEHRQRTFYGPVGCCKCGQRGYRGRVGVFEFLECTRAVHDAFAAGDRPALEQAARQAGWRPLREVALDKVFRGETTVDEALAAGIFED